MSCDHKKKDRPLAALNGCKTCDAAMRITEGASGVLDLAKCQDPELWENTPERVLKAWQELLAGYAQDPEQILRRTFDEEYSDEMVTISDIEFYSTCEHHLLPFVGRAHVAYIPDGDRVVGASKLARLVDCFARRLQIQERMTRQITGAIENELRPKGCGAVVVASHMCMRCRGVRKQQSQMVTSSLKGIFKDVSVRQEFLSWVGVRHEGVR